MSKNYIKTFEGYSNDGDVKEIFNTIDEILLELKDSGFSVIIGRGWIRIQKDHEKSFRFHEVDEYIERLKDFLGKDFLSFRKKYATPLSRNLDFVVIIVTDWMSEYSLMSNESNNILNLLHQQKQNIKDILLELEDVGFYVRVEDSMLIIRNPNFESFEFSDVREYVKRLKDFLGDKYKGYKTTKSGGNPFSGFSQKITLVKINYDPILIH